MIRQTSGWVIATALAISIAVVAGVYLRAEYAAAPQIAVAPAPGASAEVEAGAEQETTAAPEVLPEGGTPVNKVGIVDQDKDPQLKLRSSHSSAVRTSS